MDKDGKNNDGGSVPPADGAARRAELSEAEEKNMEEYRKAMSFWIIWKGHCHRNR